MITASIRATPIVVPDDDDDDDDEDNEENDEDDDSDRFDRMYGRRRHSRYSDSDGSVSGDPDAYYGGYGECHNCGRRGHWYAGCPY